MGDPWYKDDEIGALHAARNCRRSLVLTGTPAMLDEVIVHADFPTMQFDVGYSTIKISSSQQ